MPGTTDTPTINDALPTELLDIILLRTVPEPMRLILARVCTLWREIVLASETSDSDDVAKADRSKTAGGDVGHRNSVALYVDSKRISRWSLLEAYAAHDDALGLFEWFDAIGRPRTTTACAKAALYGRMATLAWLVEHGWPIDMDVYESAASCKVDGVLEWLVARPDPPCLNTTTLRNALRAGFATRRLDWLVDTAGAPWPNGPIGALWSAARSGKVETVEWVARRGPQPPAWGDALQGASYDGHVTILDYVETISNAQGAQISDLDYTLAFRCAARHGHFPVLEWMVVRRPDLVTDIDTLHEVAGEGDVTAVRWLVERNMEKNPTYKAHRSMATAAAKYGRLDTLRYLCEPQRERTGGDQSPPAPICRPDSDIYLVAAGRGHWHVVDWAVAAGVDWDVNGIVRWFLNLPRCSKDERDRCMSLVDRGIWKCSPSVRDLVAAWPIAQSTSGDDSDGSNAQAQSDHLLGMQYLVDGMFKALGSNSTYNVDGTSARLFGMIFNMLAA